MAEAVAAHVRSNGTTKVPPKNVDKRGQSSVTQVHLYTHAYMPASRWNLYLDPKLTWPEKTEDAGDFLIQIGCRHPNDETCKHLLAILSICHQQVLSPDDAYKAIRIFGL